jgi:hypothetical protein
MSQLIIWILNISIACIASILLWFVFPYVDKWGSRRVVGVRPAARAALIMLLFFSAFGASLYVLFRAGVNKHDFTFYYAIWMAPFFITLIFTVIKSNRTHRRTLGDGTRKYYGRIELLPNEQFFQEFHVYLFRGFEINGCRGTLFITSLRLIFEPYSRNVRQSHEEFVLAKLLNIAAKSTWGFIPDRVRILVGDRTLEFTIPWNRNKVVGLIEKIRKNTS